jgi:putative FmdB family regulatory protein
MAVYEYACRGCGVFELARPMGTAPSVAGCPACGEPAPRRFSAPALTAPHAPARRARELADTSAHEPTVTSRVPPPPRRSAQPPNPLHAKLPRP